MVRNKKAKSKAEGPYSDLALHTIGWKAFQDLCSQICEFALKTPVEIFREAQDGGQDAVFLIPSQDQGASSIGTVQCKHVSDPKKRLVPSDLTPELEKVKELVRDGQAETYIFLTNMGIDAPVAKQMRQTLQDMGVKKPRIWGKDIIVRFIRSSPRLRALVPQVYGLGDLSIIIDERAVAQTEALLGHWLPKLKSYVATKPHDKAVRALDEHGVVLLLGNPSTGKSTIGAILSTIASEDENHKVLMLTNPKEFEKHWNANDRGRFFWIDDAFGPNVMREDFVQDWTGLFSKVQVAIELGNRFLLTSRRHIYEAAKPKLGQRNLPMFLDNSAVVDVGDLTSSEKAQILYNHVNFGKQSTEWKSSAKNHLEKVARVANFLPGIAERLGNPAFTNGLLTTEQSLTKFMAEPREHLVRTIEELDQTSLSALTLVYVHRGRLEVSSVDRDAAEAITSATSVSLQAMIDCLPTLSDSFLKVSTTETGQVWDFEHPTIADAMTEILGKRSTMLAALLRGANVATILGGFVCEGVQAIKDTATIPKELDKILVNRLVSVPDEYSHNRPLFQFLANRASDSVLMKVVAADSGILARKTWSYGSVWIDPKVNAHARAHVLGILGNELRADTAEKLEYAALTDFDLSFLREDEMLSLLLPRNLVALGIKLRVFIENGMADKITEIGEEADLDEDPDSHFENLSEGLEILEELAGIDCEEDKSHQWAYEAISDEVQNITGRQEEKNQQDYDSDPGWVSARQTPTSSSDGFASRKNDDTGRSIFHDVDK